MIFVGWNVFNALDLAYMIMKIFDRLLERPALQD